MFHVRPTSFIILSATLVAMTGCGTKDTSVCCALASPPGSSGSQTSSPTSTPVAGTPTASPVAGTPTATPVAGTPTATPVAGTPTATPVGVTPTATPVGAPTATPVPTPVPSVQFLVFTPTSLNITGIDSTLSFTVQDQTQNGYAGFYTATSENTSIATVAQGSGFATFVVTSVAAGSTFIDVSSTDGGFNRLPVTVTNSGTVVNTRKAKS